MNSVCVPEEVYFGLYNKIGRLAEENRNLKHLNENQLNMIMDLRNEITDLKKQKEDLCELVGKTKSDCKKLCAEYSALVSTNTQYVNEIRQLKRKLDVGCNTCPDMENTKKKNDELKELVEYKRKAIEDLQEKNQILEDSIKQLQNEGFKKEENIHYWAERAHELQKEISTMIYKGDSDASEAVLKDADAKIAELKKNHEVAMNNQRETYRAELKKREEDIREYRKDNCRLRKELDDARYLYGALIKELARVAVGGEEQCSSLHV